MIPVVFERLHEPYVAANQKSLQQIIKYGVRGSADYSLATEDFNEGRVGELDAASRLHLSDALEQLTMIRAAMRQLYGRRENLAPDMSRIIFRGRRLMLAKHGPLDIESMHIVQPDKTSVFGKLLTFATPTNAFRAHGLGILHVGHVIDVSSPEGSASLPNPSDLRSLDSTLGNVTT